MYAYINGYGASRDPLHDGNLGRYLEQVLEHLREHRDAGINLFLAGGYTNREDLSEAEAMHQWLKNYGLPNYVSVHLIDTTTTARDNMLEFRKRVNDVPVLIFCEYSRQPTMRFFAQKLFRQSLIQGLKFDKPSLKLAHRMKQQTVKLWLEKLAWHNKTIDALRNRLRERHVARVRAQMR